MNISLISMILFFGPIFSQMASPAVVADGITKMWAEEFLVVQIDGENYSTDENYAKCYGLAPTGKETRYFAIEQKGKVPFLRSIDEKTFRKYKNE